MGGPGKAAAVAGGLAASGFDGFQRCVEGGAGTHDSRHFGQVRLEVTTDVHRLALNRIEFADDFLLVIGQRLGQWRKQGLQRLVLRLLSQSLGPVQGQVKLAATVVELAGFG